MFDGKGFEILSKTTCILFFKNLTTDHYANIAKIINCLLSFHNSAHQQQPSLFS